MLVGVGLVGGGVVALKVYGVVNKAKFAHIYSVYSTLFKCMSNNEKYLMTINSFQKIPLFAQNPFFLHDFLKSPIIGQNPMFGSFPSFLGQ